MMPCLAHVPLLETQQYSTACSSVSLRSVLDLHKERRAYLETSSTMVWLLFSYYDYDLRITKYLGKRCMVKLLVHFRRVLHLEHVGISSPSSTSSRINRSKHDSSLQRDDDGSGTLKSQKGSKVTLVLPHVVHFSVLFN